MVGPSSNSSVSGNNTTPSPRIPLALQQVFLASQAGKNVTVAPKHGLGFKIFRRNRSTKKNTSSNASRAPSVSSLTSERETAAQATRRVMAAKKKKKAKQQAADDPQSPQSFLDEELKKRGYSTKKYCSLEGGYYCRPTPLQQASYGSRLSQAVRQSDEGLLRRMFAAGLSPNPCNNYGESLVHMVSRRGNAKLLKIMLDHGCSVQVTDDYGRTPLHDACWKADPSFEVVSMILQADKHLLYLVDCRGASPLSYVGRQKYDDWIVFLKSNILDKYWPRRNVAVEGQDRPPALTLRPPHSMPIPDPGHALPLDVAALVANGRMQPEEALYLDDESDTGTGSYDDDSSDYDDDDDSDDDSYSSTNDEDSEFDQSEMAEFCLRAGGPLAIAQRCFSNKKGLTTTTRKHN